MTHAELVENGAGIISIRKSLVEDDAVATIIRISEPHATPHGTAQPCPKLYLVRFFVNA